MRKGRRGLMGIALSDLPSYMPTNMDVDVTPTLSPSYTTGTPSTKRHPTPSHATNRSIDVHRLRDNVDLPMDDHDAASSSVPSHHKHNRHYSINGTSNQSESEKTNSTPSSLLGATPAMPEAKRRKLDDSGVAQTRGDGPCTNSAQNNSTTHDSRRSNTDDIDTHVDNHVSPPIAALRSHFLPVSSNTLESDAFRYAVGNAHLPPSTSTPRAIWLQGPRGHGKTQFLRNIYNVRSGTSMATMSSLPSSSQTVRPLTSGTRRRLPINFVLWNMFEHSCGGATPMSSSDAMIDHLFQIHNTVAPTNTGFGVLVLEYLDDCFALAEAMDGDGKQDEMYISNTTQRGREHENASVFANPLPPKKRRSDSNQQNLAMGIVRFLAYAANQAQFRIFITTERCDNWWLRLIHRTLFPRAPSSDVSSSNTTHSANTQPLGWPSHFVCPKAAISPPLAWQKHMVVFSPINVGDVVNTIVRLINHLTYDNIRPLCVDEGFTPDEIRQLASACADTAFHRPTLERPTSSEFVARAQQVWPPVQDRLATWCSSSMTKMPLVDEAWRVFVNTPSSRSSSIDPGPGRYLHHQMAGVDVDADVEMDTDGVDSTGLQLKTLLLSFLQHRIRHVLGCCRCDLRRTLTNLLYTVHQLSESDEDVVATPTPTMTQLNRWLESPTSFDQWIKKCDFGLMATTNWTIADMPTQCVPSPGDVAVEPFVTGQNDTVVANTMDTPGIASGLTQNTPPALLLCLCLHPKTYHLTLTFHRDLFQQCVVQFGIIGLLQQLGRNACRRPVAIGNHFTSLFPVGAFETKSLRAKLVPQRHDKSVISSHLDTHAFYATNLNTLLVSLGFGAGLSDNTQDADVNPEHEELVRLIHRCHIRTNSSMAATSTSVPPSQNATSKSLTHHSLHQQQYRPPFNIFAMQHPHPLWPALLVSLATCLYQISSTHSPPNTLPSSASTNEAWPTIGWRNAVLTNPTKGRNQQQQ